MKFAIAFLAIGVASAMPVSIGPRPYWLLDEMRDGDLKSELRKYFWWYLKGKN